MRETIEGLAVSLAGSATIWLALGLLAARCSRGRPARAHSLLALTLLGSLLTPLLIFGVQQANWGMLPAAQQGSVSLPETSGSHRVQFQQAPPFHANLPTASGSSPSEIVPGETLQPASALTLELPWRTLLFGLWLFLSLTSAFRLFVAVFLGWRTVRLSRLVTEPSLIRALDTAVERLGLASKPVCLRSSKTIASPALWAWSRPATILIPETIQLSAGSEAVFCHELAHLGRRDHWIALLIESGLCLLPWHPLMWLTRRWLDECAEEACDDWAIASGCPPLDYAETLVGLVPTAKPALTMAAVSCRSPLRARVNRLLTGDFRSPRLGRGWLAGAIFAAAFLAVGVALWQPRQVGAKPAGEDPTAKKTAAPGRTLRVVVYDPDGKPLADANVHVGIWTEEKGFKSNRDYSTDRQGVALVEVPETFTILRLWARKKSFVPLFANWEQAELAKGRGLPEEFAFRLERGVSVGGRVVDEDGKPIAGARVEVVLATDTRPARLDGRISYDRWLAEETEFVRTDADGRWRINSVPDHPEVMLQVKLSHPEYVADELWRTPQKAGHATEELRRQSSIMVMKKGITLHGRVLTVSGDPLAKAVIIHGDNPDASTVPCNATTDADGRFSLASLPKGPNTITIVAPGWAPQLHLVNVHDGLSDQEFQLSRGKPIRMQFVDTKGSPIPEVWVSLLEWRSRKSLHNHKRKRLHDIGIPRQASKDGIWEWSWAPEDTVKIQVGTDGLAEQVLEVRGGDPAQTVVLKPMHHVTGQVTDATTGRPIPQFMVIPIKVFTKEFQSTLRFAATPGKNGQLAFLADRYDVPMKLRIEAEGYRSQDGPEFRVGDDGAREQNFRLQPSPPLTGMVVDAAGHSVPKAEVHLATPTEQANLSTAGGLPRGVTDATGRFAFPDSGEPWAVVIESAAGFALAEFPTNRHDAGRIQLQPWASVRGTLHDGGRPVSGATVLLQPIRLNLPNRPMIDATQQVITDGQGRFEFSRVPAQAVVVSAFLAPWRDEGFRSGPIVPLKLEPGQKVDLKLGSSGTTILGRVKLTGNVPADLDCAFSLNYLIRRQPVIAAPSEIAQLGFDVRKGWNPTWLRTKEGQAYLSTLQQWFVKLAPDGTFRISGVPEGEYDLAVEIHARPKGCLVDPRAHAVVRVNVSALDVQRGELKLPEISAPIVPVAATGQLK